MRRDVLGYRAKFAAIGPSTNTVVQPDFEAMRPPGVTCHYRPILTPNAKAISNETFKAGIDVIAANTMDAVRVAMTMEPDGFVMGMSSITFYGGVAGAQRFIRQVHEETGLKVSCGSVATAEALQRYGGVRRIAFLSPYWPVMNDIVRTYFQEAGYEVVRDVAMHASSWTGIATFTTAQCREALRRLDGDDIDALVQVGTNLSMVKLAAAAELWLGKPVVAINTATWWHALRTHGISDRIEGFGRLLDEF
jgi:maleate isomerase